MLIIISHIPSQEKSVITRALNINYTDVLYHIICVIYICICIHVLYMYVMFLYHAIFVLDICM
jgi:hypothetical protein